MANKPKFFDIEDSVTGKVYRVETDAEDATYEEAAGYLETLPEDQWQQFEYNPSVPVEEGAAPVASPQPAPAGAAVSVQNQAPVETGDTTNNLTTTSKMGADRVGTYENYEVQPFSPEDEATYIRMSQDPTITGQQIAEWAQTRGAVINVDEERLQRYRDAVDKGEGFANDVTYKRIEEDLLGDYTPDIDPTIDSDWGAALEKGMAYNPMGLGSRLLQDLFDAEQGGISKEMLRERFPDMDDEQLEKVHDNLIGELRRRELINANFQVDSRDVNPFVDFAGDVVGGASPLDLLGPTRAASIGQKLAIAGGANFIADGALQAGDIAYGAQNEYDPVQGAVSAAAGAALEGVVELGIAGVKRVLRPNESPDASVSTVTAAAGPIVVPTGDRRTKSYREGMNAALQQASDHINKTVEGWTNRPEITVHGNFAKLKGVENKALGVFMGDGTIALNMEQIAKKASREGLTPEEVIDSVVFHESLGHYALNQEYGATLDDMLDTFYTNGTTAFQRKVDEWLADPKHAKIYANGDPRGIIDDPELYRRVRATEEVVAKWAEDSGVIPVKYIDTFINMVKDFLRRMNIKGYQPAYSPREVKSLLAVAQQQVLRKSGTDATGPGEVKYMYIGRQELENNRARGTGTTWNGILLDDLETTQDSFANEMMMADPADRPAIFQKYSTDGESRQVTGWFIGPDKKWRFEISDQNAGLGFLPAPGETVPLKDVLYHPELYEFYQNLGDDIDVTTKVMPSNHLGSFDSDTGLLTLNSKYREALFRNAPEDQGEITRALETVLHEVQHGIQDMEGFARGGGPRMALRNLPDDVLFRGAANHAQYIKEVEAVEIATVLDAVDSLKELPEYKAYAVEQDASDALYKRVEEIRKKYFPDKYPSYAEENTIPELAAIKEEWNAQTRKAYAAKDAMHTALGLPRYVTMSDGLTRKAVDFYNEMMWLVRNPDSYTRKEEFLKQRLDEASQLESAVSRQNREDAMSVLRKDEDIAFDAYEHLFGEVESRDVEARRTMNYEERRAASPYSSTGILPENYAVTFTGRGPNQSIDQPVSGNRYMMDDEDGGAPFIDPRRPISVPNAGQLSDNIAPATADDLFEIQSAEDILLQLEEGYTPEVRSWEDVKRDRSLNKGITAGEIKKLKGVGDISLRLYQYEALQQKLNDKVTELYFKMQTGGTTPQIKAQYLETMFKFKELSARIFEDQAEVGRALNFMKNLTLTRRKLGDINELLREYNSNGLGAFASDDFFNDFAQQMQYMINSGNPAGAANIIKQVEKPYWWQYILSARHASMLSGIGTHAKNAYDGLMMIAREMEETAMALPLFYGRKGMQAMGMNVKDGVSPQEVVARTYGLMRALLDSGTYKDTAKAFWEGHQSRSYSAKIEMSDARIPVLSKVNDALYASDTFFRAFHMNANLYTLGVRKAREDGFTGMRALEEGTANAMNPTKEMLDKARDMADVTLLVDSPSAIGNLVEPSKAIRPNMKGEDQAKSFVANLMFPFLRVTDRLLFQAIRRSPLSFLDKNTRAEWRAGGPERDVAIARTVYGSALMAYYWQQAGGEEDEEGDVEGAGPGDYQKQQSLEATGYRANSVVEGGRMIDITALNLSMNPLGVDNNIAAQVASIRQAWERGAKGDTEAEEAANGFTEVGRALLGVLASQSYAENLSTFINPLTETDPSKRENLESAFVGGLASQFVPAAGRQVTQQVLDPERKVTRGDGSFADRVYGRIASGIPGLSETLPDRVDALGDTMPQGRTLLGIGNYTEIKQDDVSKEIRNIDRQTTKPLLVGAPTSFQLEGSTVRLTAEQQQKWNSIQGRLIREVMTVAVAEPEWKTLEVKDKVEFVRELRKEAYEEAKMELLPDINFEVQIKEEKL